MANRMDLTGRRFGKLTVVRSVKDTSSPYACWLCSCDCGRQIIVDSRKLRRGTVTSCGCEHAPGQRAQDLTGRRFGKLTVIGPAPSVKEKRMWQCRCDCGTLTVASDAELKTGQTENCGCEKKEPRVCPRNLKGRRFGKLVAIRPSDRRDSKGSVYWECHCDCGNTAYVTVDALTSGNTKSCGCLKKETQEHIHGQLSLVDGTCVEWLKSRKHRKDNTTGFRGIQKRSGGTYVAYIGFKGKKYYIGSFGTYPEAVSARKAAEDKIHGGFLKAYAAWTAVAEENPEWTKAHPLVFEVTKRDHEFVIHSNVSYE